MWGGLRSKHTTRSRAKAYRFEALSQQRHPFLNSNFHITANKLIRQKARGLVHDNPIATRAKAIYPAYVGPIRPFVHNSSKSKRHALVQEKLDEFFKTTNCDIQGLSNLSDIQSRMIGSMVEDGESFIERVWVNDWKEKSLPVPIQLKVVGAETVSMETDRKNKKIYGFEVDKYGRRTYVHLQSEKGLYKASFSDFAHLFKVQTTNQLRGLSWFTPLVIRLKDVDQYQDATTVMMKMASMYVGSWEDTGSGYELGREFSDIEIDQLVESLMSKVTPGTILPPVPRRRLTFNNPPQAGNFRENNQEFIRAISTGLNVPSVLLTNDYSESNRASMRVNFSDFERHILTEQNRWITQVGNKLVWWFKEALDSISIPTTDIKIGWILPRKIQVEPDKEMSAMMVEIGAGLKSPFEAMRELGREPEEVLEEIRHAQNRFNECGFTQVMAGQQMTIYNKEDE